MEFVGEKAVQSGRCTEIGFGGMRLDLPDSLPADLNATIQISYCGLLLEIPARVVHRVPGGNGIQFLWESDEQRQGVAQLIDLLNDGAKYPTPYAKMSLLQHKGNDHSALWRS